MSLPKPALPKSSKHNSHAQFHRHLPSPVKPHLHQPKREEKKHNYHTNHRNEVSIYPNTFDQKFNTKHINWNELHYIAIHKGRIMFVGHIIKTHYASYLTNYSVCVSNKHNINLPNIPHLSSKILSFIHQILYETKTVQQSHNRLHTHSNWETQVDNYDNISVYYRKEENSTNEIHSIKISFTSKCHPVDFIAVINEFDLMKEIVTIVPLETKYLKEWTHLNKLIYSKIFMWWPFKHRDAIVHINAYDLLSEYDEILICGKSCNEIKGINTPKLDKKTMRVDIRMGQGAIKPKLMNNGALGTEVTAMLNVDFQTILPKTLVNWITRTFAYYACKMIRDRTENLEGTTHQQRVKERQIYKEWNKTFAEWKKRKFQTT